jgi:hypothetical protein
MITNYILFAVFVALQCGDAWTTIQCLKSGKGVEGNPFMAKIFNKLGLTKGFLVTKLSVIVLLGAGVFNSPELAGLIALSIVDVIYAYIVYQNYKILKA